MRYLTVDGYFDGTGIRDAANGGYLEHDEVGISPDLSKCGWSNIGRSS